MSSNINITNRLSIQDDGSVIAANAKSINFAGAGVVASAIGDDVIVTITGGGGGGGGTVTSVSALTIGTTGTDISSTVVNSTTTPVITINIPTASALNRGALSASDWSAFNSKQNAISLTTTGTSGLATFVGNVLNIPQYIGLNDLTGSSPINYDPSLGIISISQASATSEGYISSGDWTIFNSKQNALSGGVTNQLTKWTSSSALGNSVLTELSTGLVGVSITSPTAKFHINNTGGTDSFLVEDSTNPDTTPFVIDTAGNVGVGVLTPSTSGKLVVQSNGATGLVLDTDTASSTSSTRLFFKSSTASKDVSVFNAAGALRFAFAGTANTSSGNTKYIMTESGSMLFNATAPTITPVAPITAYATAVATNAEEIARFGVYSLSSPGNTLGATLSLRNGTTTDDEFLPQLRGSQATTSALSALQIDALLPNAQDTAGNTNPALIIRTGNSSGATLNNRPLFDLRNGSASALFVDAGNQIGINTTVPQFTLDVSGSGIRSYYTGSPSNAVAMSGDILGDNNLVSTHDLSSPVDFVINATSNLSTNTLTSTYLRIKTFGQDAVVIDNVQNIGFGTATPSVKVHINSATSGAFRLVDTTQAANKYLKSDANGVGTWSNISVSDTGLTVTTTGTSGAATLVGNTLNIPQYSAASQNLASVLTVGNTASTDIDMSGFDVTNVDEVSTSATTMKLQSVLNSTLIFYANNC